MVVFALTSAVQFAAHVDRDGERERGRERER